MTDEPVPRPLTILGEAFRFMAETLRTRMDEAPFETGSVFNIFDLLDEHVQLLNDHVSAFGTQVNEGLGLLTYESDEHFHGVARRIRAELEGILDGYDNVRGLQASAEDFEGWSLLVGIYEETLYQIQVWLDEVVDFLDDPVAGAKKRGLSADGNDVVNLRLVMKPPHQIDRLTSWLTGKHDSMAAQDQNAWEQEQRSAHRHSMIAGTLIGLFLGKSSPETGVTRPSF